MPSDENIIVATTENNSRLPNITKNLINSGDNLLKLSFRVLGRTTLALTFAQNAILSLPETIILLIPELSKISIVAKYGVKYGFKELDELFNQSTYQRNDEIIAEFVLSVFPWIIITTLMVIKYPLPFGPIDAKWLDNFKNYENEEFYFHIFFNNVPSITYYLLVASCFSKISVIPIKLINSYLKNDNISNESTTLLSKNNTRNNNIVMKMINFCKTTSKLLELAAMINIFINPPKFAERFGYTSFTMKFDDPYLTRVGSLVNSICIVENIFNGYEKVKSFSKNIYNYFRNNIEIQTSQPKESWTSICENLESINPTDLEDQPSTSGYKPSTSKSPQM